MKSGGSGKEAVPFLKPLLTTGGGSDDNGVRKVDFVHFLM